MRHTIEFVYRKLSNEPSGHDYLHAMRVFRNSEMLLTDELDKNVILASALVHDLIDHKLDPIFKASNTEITEVLLQDGLTDPQVKHVFDIIENLSFSKGSTPSSMEGKVVQDADRLDALGAIGIARAFSYGGKQGRLIYDPTTTDGNDSVSHFYQKLFHLVKLMHTDQGRLEAQRRTEYMKQYIQTLNSEVQSNK